MSGSSGVLNMLEKILKVLEKVSSILETLKQRSQTSTEKKTDDGPAKKTDEEEEEEQVSENNYSTDEFADKVEYEGGIFAALEQGLRAEDLADPTSALGQAWTELQTRFDELKPLCDEVQAHLDATWEY